MVFVHIHDVSVTKCKFAFYFLYAVRLDLNDPLLRCYVDLKYLRFLSVSALLGLTRTKSPRDSFVNHIKIWPLQSKSLKKYAILVFRYFRRARKEKFTYNYNAWGKNGGGWMDIMPDKMKKGLSPQKPLWQVHCGIDSCISDLSLPLWSAWHLTECHLIWFTEHSNWSVDSL